MAPETPLPMVIANVPAMSARQLRLPRPRRGRGSAFGERFQHSVADIPQFVSVPVVSPLSRKTIADAAAAADESAIYAEFFRSCKRSWTMQPTA